MIVLWIYQEAQTRGEEDMLEKIRLKKDVIAVSRVSLIPNMEKIVTLLLEI